MIPRLVLREKSGRTIKSEEQVNSCLPLLLLHPCAEPFLQGTDQLQWYMTYPNYCHSSYHCS